MLPKNWKLVAIPVFGQPCTIVAEVDYANIDPTTGAVNYDGSSDELLNASPNDTAISSLDQDNTVNGWYEFTGSIQITGTALTGTVHVYLVNNTDNITGYDNLGKLLTVVTFSGQSQLNQDFDSWGPR